MLQGQPSKVAVILGALGLFPFLSLGAIAVAGPTIYIDNARVALLAYGAVILSFLGGTHWGYCIAGADGKSSSNTIRLLSSVTPSILAWLTLLLPTQVAMYGLSCALAGMLIFDIWAAHRGWAPTWYPTLRWPLSFGAVISTLVAVAF